jgi:hypothetical protein
MERELSCAQSTSSLAIKGNVLPGALCLTTVGPLFLVFVGTTEGQLVSTVLASGPGERAAPRVASEYSGVGTVTCVLPCQVVGGCCVAAISMEGVLSVFRVDGTTGKLVRRVPATVDLNSYRVPRNVVCGLQVPPECRSDRPTDSSLLLLANATHLRAFDMQHWDSAGVQHLWTVTMVGITKSLACFRAAASSEVLVVAGLNEGSLMAVNLQGVAVDHVRLLDLLPMRAEDDNDDDDDEEEDLDGLDSALAGASVIAARPGLSPFDEATPTSMDGSVTTLRSLYVTSLRFVASARSHSIVPRTV